MIRFLDYKKDRRTIEDILSRRLPYDDKILRQVAKIIEAVEERDDQALLEFTEKYDKMKFASARRFRVSESKLKKAWDDTPDPLKDAFKIAAERIRKFHERQFPSNYSLIEEEGIWLHHQFLPLESVGIYVPGGLAEYPSSVLMNVIPAQIAQVKRIILVTPPTRSKKTSLAFATAYLLGIKEVYQVGGAQAIAALAFGTKTIPKVDKVVGPGNVYVAYAKRLLYGVIDIDMIAGPSEIMVVADTSADVRFVVADLLSQAEHSPDAVPIAIFIGRIELKTFLEELERQVNDSPRRSIIKKSLATQGLVISVPDRNTAVELINLKAPEHLELMVRNPYGLVKKIRNAGAIFVGEFTPEAIGDYVAGPNHTLPTGGTARFFSPLSVLDFMKTNHVVELSKEAFIGLGDIAALIAESEKLFAHANAIYIRKQKLTRE
ncbi:histidinol dehydrogenase [Candidatus Sumerlaeota bacterium]|nr:histidinol dehydrogenase [Candidatus Sumerlaeota bacterium]